MAALGFNPQEEESRGGHRIEGAMVTGLILAAVMAGVYVTLLIVMAAALERKHRR